MRYEEALGKLKTVGIDLVTLLPDIAGWQAPNLAGLSEDALERVVTELPDDSCPLAAIQEELNRVYATIHISERSGSGPARAPGRSWTSCEPHQCNRDDWHPRQCFGNACQANVAESQHYPPQHQHEPSAADNDYGEDSQYDEQDGVPRRGRR